ncbi:Hsp20/alpha crystallin family protein [Bacillus nakamurai]|uniref:Spore gernimation protein GerT n=1 Tax=Bacillus nakamurai TaxID=1793963 RepID=A0A150F979_9BACI|nr:Hsp20/alpha crystallin family protein [Bacillus nakamurai]KXZ21712.1 spore gernimation protein GerT [Bacillus nakamurai]MCC9021579.1 Hsp20/alpha crystallin family protein [Bacillus nakamurai]MED1226586.1 Hsp20/alpha crystallin family protein [Bacillus nakamurai]
MFEWNRYFPFNNQFSKETFKNADPKDVESYVNQVMESVFGSDYAGQFPFRDPLSKKTEPVEAEPPKPEIDLFETSDHVFAKIPVEQDELDHIRIKHTSHSLVIENSSLSEEKKEIVLPSLVKRKGTKAVYRDGIIEVMFSKQEDYNLSEVEIMR